MSFPGLVAVAVMTWPSGTWTPATKIVRPRPVAFVVSVFEPRYVSPSPNVDGSQVGLLKKSRVYVVLGALTSVVVTVVVPPPEVAAVYEA